MRGSCALGARADCLPFGSVPKSIETKTNNRSHKSQERNAHEVQSGLLRLGFVSEPEHKKKKGRDDNKLQ